MTLPGTCPECGLRADLVVFASAADTNRALAAALELPAPLGGRVLQYLRLFSPPRKVLASGKATRLLTELAAAIGEARVERRGVTWPAPLALWEAALDAVLATPPERLPLTSHAYLFEVVAGLAAKDHGRTERQREDQARYRPTLGAPKTSAVASPVQELANDLRALKTLEAHNPGQHTAAIARIQQQLAALQPQPQPQEDPSHA